MSEMLRWGLSSLVKEEWLRDQAVRFAQTRWLFNLNNHLVCSR
jgi:hypothetical protein